MSETKKTGLKFFIVILVIIITGIYIVIWTKKNYSVNFFSKEDISAFQSKMDVDLNDDYKFYEPNLNDLSYTVNYRIGKEGDSTENNEKISKNENAGYGKKRKKSERTDKNKNKQTTAENDDYSTSNIKKKEMASIGYKKGFLTQAVGKLLNHPKAIRALFNNKYVVQGFLSRDIVRRNLSDPNALKEYLSNKTVVSNFLNNEIVKQAMANPQVVSAIASSQLITEITNSPAVQQLMSDPQTMSELMQKNPELSTLITNPNILNALNQNPNTKGLTSNLFSNQIMSKSVGF